MAPTTSVIDTTASISNLVDSIIDLPSDPPSLYFDLEGIKLSREGSISIFQLFVVPQNRVYLIDIHVLKASVFSTAGETGSHFKDILESATIAKVVFDVRNDSDALHHHYGIALQGIQDVQLMENASRPSTRSKQYINGLARCIEFDALLSLQQKKTWKDVKERGARLFAPEKGGSYDVFNARPLRAEILEYCVQDVHFLPSLRQSYWARLNSDWRKKVEDATKARVQLSQSAGYQPHGEYKKFGPW